MIKCENSCPLGKFNGCCYCCPEKETCQEMCSEVPEKCGCSVYEEGQELELFKNQQMTVLQNIADLCTAKKQIEAQEKGLKDKLKQAMEQYGIKKFESEILNITYVPEGTQTKVDTTKLKKLHPDVAAECSKTSKTSSYIKVTVKGGDE